MCLTIYPQAGEATAIRRTTPRRACLRLSVNDQGAPSPHNDEDAALRAKRKVRRWTRANRCRFLWTLTFAEAVRTREQAGAALDRFLRGVQRKIGKLPILAVIEPHPGGHGFHWHFATDRRLPHRLVRALWGLGHVWVGDPGKLPGRVASRKLAAYLSKYVSKSITLAKEPDGTVERRRSGQHRYRVTQGFEPRAVQTDCRTHSAAYAILLDNYGRPDRVAPFALLTDGPLDSCWYSFPDRYLHPPPRVAAGI